MNEHSSRSMRYGSERWRQKLGDPISRVEFGNDTVYVPNGSRVVAFDVDSGEKRWERDTEAGRAYWVTSAKKTVFVTTQAGVQALSAVDGTRRWGTAERGLDDVFLVLADADRAYCTNGKTLFAFEPEDGSPSELDSTVPDQVARCVRKRWPSILPSGIGRW